MKKKLIIIISLILIIIVSIFGIIKYKLKTNATYYSEIYHGRGHDIYIPLHSYLKEECCMTAAVFYSMRSKEDLESEIDKYLSDFNKLEYGYRKDNLYIQSYIVEDKGLYRQIVITY